jgi:hypothetical protein
MKGVIVTTTINPPTEAIFRFDAMPNWHLVVIGDLKTPPDYRLANGTYLGPDDQERYDKRLSDAIGWNCIQRRNIGLCVARDLGADVVAVVDDDNIPLPGWGEELLIGRETEVTYFLTDLPAFDPIGATNHSQLWHRGYPLELLARRDYSRSERRSVVADVQADFWNGDPDIDAVCRMEHAPDCCFDPACFPLAADKPAPFNSQNTFLSAALLGDYFLFPHVGRMDDIWAAYYVQALGRQVVFCRPSVIQARNPHDLLRDMRQELLGYENNLALLGELATDPEAIVSYLPGRAVHAWRLFRRHFRNNA